MMVIIGLWMWHGEGRQRHKQPKESLQQFLFSEGRGGNRASSPSENDESQSSRGAEFVFRNRRVADGGSGAVISDLAVGVEWSGVEWSGPLTSPGEARSMT